MKRTTFDDLKCDDLAAALTISRSTAIGLIESLFQFTAKHAPAGDVGKFKDDAIARAIRCELNPKALIDALVSTEWLELSEPHRLIVADWPYQCEDSIHTKLALKRMFFASGETPKTSRLSRRARKLIEEHYLTPTDDAVELPVAIPAQFVTPSASLALEVIGRCFSQQWNALGKPFARIEWTNERQTAFTKRWDDEFFRTNWKVALGKLKVSHVCRGETDRSTWVADVEWFLRGATSGSPVDTVRKLMEGTVTNPEPSDSEAESDGV